MANEYVLPIGSDASGLLNDLREVKSQIAQLQSTAKQLTGKMQTGFADVSEAQNKATQSVINGNKAIKEQTGLAQQLAQVYDTLATSAAKANDTAPIKKYADEFKRLSDLAAKTTNLKVNFDDSDILVFSTVLKQTGDQTKALSTLLDILKGKLKALDPNSNEFKLLSEQISVAEQVITEFNGEIDNTAKKSSSLKGQLRALKQELALMEDQGLDNTKNFQDMAIKAGQLEDQLGDTSARIRVLASDTKYIDATIQAVTAVTAGFGLAQGATALFGSENKELAEVLNKVQGAMLILTSLQQIQQIIQKQSALSVLTMRSARVADTVAMKAQTIATATQTSVTEAATVATKGLWATLLSNPIGWVLAAVGALIAAFASMKSKAEEAQEKIDALNESTLKFADIGLKGNLAYNERQKSLDIARLKEKGATEQEIFKTQQYWDKLAIQSKENYLEEIRGAGGDEVGIETEIKNDKAKLLVEQLNFQADQNKKAQEQAKADYQKRLALQQAYNKSFTELQKQFRDTQAELLQADRDREKQVAYNTLTDQLKSIQDLINEQRKSGTITSDLLKVAYDQKNQLIRVYNAKVLKIDAEFYANQKALLISANEALNEIIRDKTDNDIDQINKKFDGIIKSLNEQNQNLLKQTKLTDEDKAAIYANNNIIFDLNNAREVAIKNLIRDSNIEKLNNQKELAESTIDLLKVTGLSEEELTELKEANKLKVEKEYAKKSLQLIGNSLIEQRKITKEQFDELLNPDNLQAAATKGITIFDLLGINTKIDDETKAKIQAFLKTLNIEVKAQADNPEFDLGNYLSDAFFGNSKEGREFGKLFAKAMGDAFKQLTQSMESEAQRQIDAIQRVIDTLNDQIDTQEDIVDRQQDLAEKGLANNLSVEQKKLDALRANKTAELAAQQQAQVKLEEIRKKEAILQAAAILATNIETGVRLANAAAKAIESSSGIPFVGVALGIAGAALIVSTFLSIKNAIEAAQSSVPKFEEGGGMELKGRSHKEGGIGLYDGNRKIAEYEDGEYLYAVSKPKTKKYKPLLEAINQDDLPSMRKYLSGILGGSRMPDHVMRETLDLIHENEDSEISKERDRIELYRALNSRKNSKNTHSTTVLKEGSLSSIDENIKELVSLHKKPKKEIIDMGSYFIEVEGNRRRKINKKNV